MPEEFDRFTRLAQARIEGGYPTPDARRQLEDELYFQRAVHVYLPDPYPGAARRMSNEYV
ncbi:hypothetical protein [Rhodococcus sp. WB9]|uniref:hypothetical protein n=1 Tax=Rhodococcus sp. WB9 TaxID=2594007 RepID=UPI0016428CDA|nr:hypothetical protein [Rhodococcus sp. WB9]